MLEKSFGDVESMECLGDASSWEDFLGLFGSWDIMGNMERA